MADEYNDPIQHIDEAPSDPYGIESATIDVGIRKTLNTCQFWIKGLPGPCAHWEPGDPGNCTYEEYNQKHQRIYPSGWNFGHCDFLGRRASCNKYELGGAEDLDQYICIAPNPFISGQFKDVDGIKKAVPKSDIRGYNADGDFVGRCDGCGFGRGPNGYTVSDQGENCASDAFNKLPPVCNYYKPWHMGFGAQTPKTTDIKHAKIDKKTGRIIGDERDTVDERLPLSFRVYNLRAKLQKCAYWDREEGSEFEFTTAGLSLESDDEDRSDFCVNTDAAATPFHTIDEDAFASYMGYQLLENVWSEAGCVVCNGARSNCPGYTGKWIYCLDDRLEKGDKVSAQQILELRFWMNDWASQAEYDSVFKRPPNKTDPSTSSIYTYGKWKVLSSKASDSILEGRKVDLCVPYMRQEFSGDLIQVEDVTYRNRTTQTKSTVAPGQVSYPNLIRDIEYINIPPLNIIYPYASKDPFNHLLNPVCGDQDSTPCIKRNNSIDGDEITVVGNTLPNKQLYAFNITQTGVHSSMDLALFDTSLAIDTTTQQRRLYEQMDELIDYLEQEKNSLLHIATSDENGLFYIGPIKLDYQKLNYLIVCFKMGDDPADWVFRKRAVWSQWHGGVIAQCDAAGGKAFEHKYAEETVYADDGYHLFTPSATAAGKLFPLYGYNPYVLSTEVRSLINANMSEVYAGLLDMHYNYSYCFKKITKKNVEIFRWKRADFAGSLWIEIQDTNLNYIFNWSVESAKVYMEDEAGNIIDSVPMNKVFPSGVYEQINIHPSACIIAPNDGKKRGFFSSDGWLVKVTYWYITIANDDDTTPPDENTEVEIIYPNFDLASTRLISGNYDIELQGEEFSVSNIIKDTAALLAIFNDDDGRPISTMATKMCVDVARVFARDVEIYYSWTGDYQTFHLEPTTGFLRVPQDGPFRLESKGYTSMGSRAPCGDHDLGFFSNTGPMWYPYSSCETTDFYDLWTGANFCVTPHEGTPRMDYRFIGPERYTPFCWPHSTLWDCAEDWGCGHHELLVGSVRFTGYARKRGALNPDLYRTMEWQLPKFGNVLREYVERFRSIDNTSHISMKNQIFAPSYAWMPLVMDNSALFFSFNCLSGNTITFVNPLNFWTVTTDVSETLEIDGGSSMRRSFDEVFDIRKTILASYPPPVLEQSSGYPYVAYYYFKDDFFQWAWQEAWHEIDRAIGEEDEKLAFVELDTPYYIFSYDKEEHRIITQEGEYELIYTAPVPDENDKRKIKTFPSIGLAGGPPRYFDPTAASTTYPSLVKWRDENEGEKDGSGGDDEGNIYEKTTTGGNWLHVNFEPYYSSMIYDSESVDVESEAEDADRKVLISYDALLDESEEYVYNRGIIAKISLDRLQYLPYEEFVIPAGSYTKTFSPALEDDELPYRWYGRDNMSMTFDFGAETFCVSKVVIRGQTGNVNVTVDDGVEKRHLQQPAITISEGGTNLGSTRVLYMTEEAIKGGIGTNIWQEEIVARPTPSRMFGNRSNQFKISFSMSGPLSYGISITKIELYEARYKDAVEHIKVWERKYNTSIGDPGNYNLDGVNRVLSYEGNYDNSGIYFFEQAHPIDGSVRAYNKMRRVRGGEHKEDMEEISVYNYASVIKAEQEQQILYETALGYEPTNITMYKTVLPPRVATFLVNTKAAAYALNNHTATLESDKTRWGNHWATAGYQAYNLWFPGGHQYQWNPTTVHTRCYIGGAFEDVMRYTFKHLHSGWEEAAAVGVVSWYAMKPAYLAAKFNKEYFLQSDVGQKLGMGQDAHSTPYVRY